MKAASIHELQKELTALEPKQLKELCIRLAKYKKDNKELLSYLLFEAHDEKAYVKNIKQEIVDNNVLLLSNYCIYICFISVIRRVMIMISTFIISTEKEFLRQCKIYPNFFISTMSTSKHLICLCIVRATLHHFFLGVH